MLNAGEQAAHAVPEAKFKQRLERLQFTGPTPTPPDVFHTPNVLPSAATSGTCPVLSSFLNLDCISLTMSFRVPQAPPPPQWRTYLSIEDRQAVRKKIRSAYAKQCRTLEELLETVTAIEEELLHASAPSRLDYFKSGYDYEHFVKLKKRQLSGMDAMDGLDSMVNASRGNNKRSKKSHADSLKAMKGKGSKVLVSSTKV